MESSLPRTAGLNSGTCVSSLATVSLFEAISETGFRASVISTYCCYFPFFEDVVLRRLVSAGSALNVLFVDSSQLARAYLADETRPRLAGTAYALIPVHAAGAFHPKILVQLGPTKGALHVGSHNTTLAGFGLNSELTASFRTEGKNAAEGAAPFVVARDFIAQFLPRKLEAVTDAFRGVFEGVPWLRDSEPQDESRGVFGSGVAGPSLWDRVQTLLPRKVDQALVVSPFFDEGLELIERIVEELRPNRLIVVIDPETVKIDEGRARKLKNVTFVSAVEQLKLPRRRETDRPYVHAKALYFAGGREELVITGSANATAPAWLASGRTRNAEAIAWDRRPGVAASLGLTACFEAPEITVTEWERIREAFEADADDDQDGRVRVFLAAPSPSGFTFEGDLATGLRLDAIGIDGKQCGVAVVDRPGSIAAEQPTIEAATELRGALGTGQALVIIHRTDEINELAASDSRKALRQAMVTLVEDPGQLEVLLRLTEKVIFDEAADSAPAAGQVHTSTDPEEAAPNDGPATLSVEAHGRRGVARRRLVRGDLGYLIDLLIRSFEEGSTEAVTEEEERGQSPEGDETTPGSLQREAARSRDLQERVRLARLCRTKTRRLVRRLNGRLEETAEGGERLLAQVAAVLNVLRVVRGLETRTEWRQRGLELVELQTLADAFECIVTSAVTNGSALFGAFGEPGALAADETAQIFGLLIWLAYEAEVDGTPEPALKLDSEEHVDEHRWYWVHLLACIAPWFVNSESAGVVAESAIRTGGGVDGERWLDAHVRLLLLVERLRTGGAGASTSSSVSVGDLAILGPTFEPRVRVVQRVTSTPRGPTIEVADFGVEKGARVFQRSAVPCFNRMNSKAAK